MLGASDGVQMTDGMMNYLAFARNDEWKEMHDLEAESPQAAAEALCEKLFVKPKHDGFIRVRVFDPLFVAGPWDYRVMCVKGAWEAEYFDDYPPSNNGHLHAALLRRYIDNRIQKAMYERALEDNKRWEHELLHGDGGPATLGITQ
jgi:hypothetical protein